MIEEWRKIKDYEGLYEISNLGRIKSFLKGKETIIKSFAHYKGHMFLYIFKSGVRKKFWVHRLVANAFIPNPQEKPIVNHIDCNKQNNLLTEVF